MQRLAPKQFEIRAGVLFLPVSARQIISRCVGLAIQQRDKFQRALAVVEWSNQGLDDARSSIVGAGIAPRFEFMRSRNVPLAKLGSLVLIEAVMHAQQNFTAF